MVSSRFEEHSKTDASTRTVLERTREVSMIVATLKKEGGVTLELDEQVELHNPRDLEHIFWLIEYHYFQAKVRGEALRVEIWSPKPLIKDTS